jgi:sacsin
MLVLPTFVFRNRVLHVCYCKHTHRELASFQGPCVWAYNDSIFSDKDWTGICSLGDSGKKEDSSATGRFGLGFNSVYHTTDVPSIMSGAHVAWFDPHQRHLPSRLPGNRVKVAGRKGASTLAKHRNLLAPYVEASKWFDHPSGIDGSAPFSGTLFRLPLRSPAQADKSELSKEVTTLEGAEKSLDIFMRELSLLFLEHVTQVEVLVMKPGYTKPVLLHRVQVVHSEEGLLQRANFSLALANHSLLGAGEAELTRCDEKVEVRRETGGSLTTERWLLCRSLANGGRFAQLADAWRQEFALLPLCGVAISLTGSQQELKGST